MKNILTNKLFMWGYVSDMLSNFGDVLYYLALMNYVLLLPNPQFALAIITFSETLPIIMGFAIGIYADKTKNKVDAIMMSLVVRFMLYVIVGVVMGFTPSLWVILAVSSVNLVSDLLGKYENGLHTPLSLRILANDEREQAFAFKQSLSSVLQMVFKAVAAILVGLFSYQHLAFVNAATFGIAALIMFLLRPSFQNLLVKQPIKPIAEVSNQSNNIFQEMWSSSQLVWREIQTIPILKQSLIIVPALNAVFAGLDVLFVYNLSQYPEMILQTSAITLAAFSITFLLGNVLAGFLVMSGRFHKVEIGQLLNLLTVSPLAIFLSFLTHNTYLIFLIVFMTALVLGIMSPKMTALILNSLPEERLATIGSGLDTYFMASIFVTRLLVSGLLVILSANQVTWLFVVASALILLSVVKSILTKKQA